MNKLIKKLALKAANKKFPQKELHEFTNTAYDFYLKGYEECLNQITIHIKKLKTNDKARTF